MSRWRCSRGLAAMVGLEVVHRHHLQSVSYLDGEGLGSLLFHQVRALKQRRKRRPGCPYSDEYHLRTSQMRRHILKNFSIGEMACWEVVR